MPKFIVQVMIREAYEVEAGDARDAEQISMCGELRSRGIPTKDTTQTLSLITY